jgi:large subunit ribosomal protein L17
MRHRVAGHHLSRTSSQRRALFRNLIRELYLHERIVTTDAKARAVRADAEKLITKAKAGVGTDGNRVHAQRQVVAYLNDMTVAKMVFDVFAPRYAVRPGGYTRIIKLGQRWGDGAEMVMLELVDAPSVTASADGDKKKGGKKSQPDKSDKADKKAKPDQKGSSEKKGWGAKR